MHSTHIYRAAIADLRGLLAKIGRREFRAYGYAALLREYRGIVRNGAAA
ncbi:hypothetical protein [Acidovorax lacteus]|uniref:Uncharacterized protein n=1 Tax=Acidovorax lacteus TaxID=1924988 RepID=A0ABP8L9C8_9BURK